MLSSRLQLILQVITHWHDQRGRRRREARVLRLRDRYLAALRSHAAETDSLEDKNEVWDAIRDIESGEDVRRRVDELREWQRDRDRSVHDRLFSGPASTPRAVKPPTVRIDLLGRKAWTGAK